MRTVNQQTPLYGTPMPKVKERMCKCGEFKTNMPTCAICQIEAKHPGTRQFAKEIRGTVTIEKKRHRRSRRGTTPYSCKFEGRQ